MTDLADIGMVGLGVMGANLAMNIAEKGHTVAIYDRDPTRMTALETSEFGARFTVCSSEADLMAAIRPPRPVILLVPAGALVDEALGQLSSEASRGDILIDAGNSDFHNTIARTARIEAAGLAFLGIGVSGGAEGARNGPAMMAGGSRDVWDRVAPVLTSIAAHHGDVACAAWLGPDGAGHFVKTVHNGIEYADMQMIAETYGILRDGLAETRDGIAEIFEDWAEGRLSSYLIEITAEVVRVDDPLTGAPLLDVIADRAGQKGTGRWSAIEGLRLGGVASCIEAAVAARNLSSETVLREALRGAIPPGGPVEIAPADLHDALLVAKIVAYAQGFDLIARASSAHDWDVDLAKVAGVWRAGCIIRSVLLDDIAAAFRANPAQNLLVSDAFRSVIVTGVSALRRVVAGAVQGGLPVPALAGALASLEQLSRPRGTANLLQGLRDCFGQHGFERTDRGGTGFHGPWVSSDG